MGEAVNRDTCFRAVLAYNGAGFLGFQRQAGDVPTIQGAVETALHRVTGRPVTIAAAGRTDTGVHAEGQVIHFCVPWSHGEEALLRALNANLPPAIAVQAVERVGGDFHPRFDARSRVYSYDIVSCPVRQPLLLGQTWWIQEPLDGVRLSAAAALLIGTHDCGAFGHPPQGENTVRTILRSEWQMWEERTSALVRIRWRYWIEANAFLQHMVRRIVGMLVDVGRAERTIDEFEQVFRGGRLVKNWTIAPPHGLTLVQVRYPAEAGQEVDE
ncbi:MAG: tRNA pseudouridine(38-40) synthase TruA, partial [Anaerolinea sp.]|nr:tRNA pseudouridine(38-40) synthase TruA [Anaerolinea sp.]